MSNKWLFFTALVALLVAFVTIAMVVLGGKEGVQDLISPKASEVKSAVSENNDSTPAYNPPKEIKYDHSTNLSGELESISPQVLEGDFEDLQNLTRSF